MTRDIVEEARNVLVLLGFDRERTNQRSALTLLALLHLRRGDQWSEATAPMLGTRAVMDWIRDEYGLDYKPNTRETVRRQTLHQFLAAGLVEENPDNPERPVNSPKWCYRVRHSALDVITGFGSSAFEEAIASYLIRRPGLVAQYEAARDEPNSGDAS